MAKTAAITFYLPNIPNPLKVEKGKTVPSEITQIVSDMVSLKSASYGASLDLFTYYMKGSVATKYVHPEWMYPTNPPGLFANSDTTPKAIANKAIAAFGSAILPLGTESITIKCSKLRLAAENRPTESPRNDVEKFEYLMTSIVRDILDTPTLLLMGAIASSIHDIMNFGSCFIVYDHGAYRHIPFEKVWYLVSPTAKWQWYFYQTDHDITYIWDNYQYKINDSKKNHILGNVIMPVQMEQDGEFSYLYLTLLLEKKIVISAKIVPSLEDVYECRMGTSNTVYSSGAGINSITNIVDANYYLNLSRYSGNFGIAPCIITSPSVASFSGALPPTQAGMAMDTNEILYTPGGVIDLNTITDGKGSMMQIVSQPAAQIEVYSKLRADALINIESAYGADLFSTLGTNVTATEVIEKKQAAIRVFNGLSSQYYAKLLLPMITKILHQAISHLQGQEEKAPILESLEAWAPNINPFTDCEIELYNFADMQKDDINSFRVTRTLQELGMAAQLAQTMGPEMTNKLFRQIMEIEKWMK